MESIANRHLNCERLGYIVAGQCNRGVSGFLLLTQCRLSAACGKTCDPYGTKTWVQRPAKQLAKQKMLDQLVQAEA